MRLESYILKLKGKEDGMKRWRLGIGIALVALVSLVGFAGITHAYNIQTGDNVSVSEHKRVDDTLYLAGRTVNVDDEVYGDVFCAGQNINVSGTVHGDVICAGQTVNVTGTVDGNVRLAGQTVTLGAHVTGNATVGGQSFVLESSGSVGGDMTTGANDATLNGPVGRDVVIGSGTITVNNKAGRNIKAQANDLTLASGARVGGNINLTSDHAVNKDKGAVVSGTITRKAPTHESKPKHGAIFGFGIAWFLYCFVAMLITAMVLILLFPHVFRRVSEQALPRPWKALLTGFLASVAVPAVITILAISIVGLPLALLVGLSWLVALLLSGPFFAYYLGRIILRSAAGNALYVMVIGASLLLILYFIPIIGLLAILAAVWIGTGMLLLEAYRHTPKPTYSLPPVPTAPKKRS